MIEVLLLLALPASGKSEIRRYLDTLSAGERMETFGLRPMVQLDDFPYVHLMRRISEEAEHLGVAPPFFAGPGPFIDQRDWGTLIHLINQDYAALSGPGSQETSAGRWLVRRMVNAREAAGAGPSFDFLDTAVVRHIEESIDGEARLLLEEVSARRLEPGGTVLIEFARGGPAGSSCPLPAPFGYQYSLSLLAAPILERSAALYIWVTPEESRQKNRERSIPGEEGSILHHGVPEQVMMDDYGMDDFRWLMSQSPLDGTIEVKSGDRILELPAAVFDNRGDLTSFLREDPASWSDEDLAGLRAGLADAFRRLSE
ncbi:MAG: hypothetical protein P1T08_10665 [Acidimicrobiia bacterium]|nr:hypothetical protein [Acidimicrobiia bacterium]